MFFRRWHHYVFSGADSKKQPEGSRSLASQVFDIESSAAKNELDSVEKELRMGFIRKIYGIISFQLFLTAITSIIMALTPSISGYVLANAWPLYLALSFYFVLLLALFKYQKEHPVNMIVLVLWTLTVAYTIGVVCAKFTAIGMGDVVIEALFLTLLVFVALTIFTFQSKIDFSFLSAAIFSSLSILTFFALINSFLGFSTEKFYALFGAVICSLFIIYDTFTILERYGYDDYIAATICLYIDVIYLFFKILRFLRYVKNPNPAA
mmetsp:Transcript_39346/g.51872  ORF Transcript_39346/g.51872 Transcript_39346/m.51872 type:complete len:265 (+) Transcript_39346:121-915(+)